MNALELVMTTAGLGRFTAAQSDTGVDLTINEVGLTAQGFTAAPSLTALPGEFRRISTVSGESLAANVVHMTVQDDAAVTYQVTGFGLFLADGTLFATYSQPLPIVEKSTGSMLALAIDIAFPQAGVENIQFGSTDFLNPPATTERKGVVELATKAEALGGIDPQRVPAIREAQAMLEARLPTGAILLWYGAEAPAGWAICDGRIVKRADGTGNIALPDLCGRVAMGVAPDRPLGAEFGERLRSVESHSAGEHGHGVSVIVGIATTGATLNTTNRNVDAGGSAGGVLTSATLNDPGHSHPTEVNLQPDGAHRHTVDIDVTQPSLALNYIMRL